MAIPFLNNINLSDNELQNAKIHITSSSPTATAGQIYFDSTTGITTVKYHDGSAWISLIEHTFNNGTFINLTESGTDATRALTADLSAAGIPSSSTFLRGDNTWATIVQENDYLTDLSFNTLNDGQLIATVKNQPDVSVNLDGRYFLISNIVEEADGIENNDNDTTIPTSAAVKAYADSLIVGGLIYQGSYNASTNTPNLTTSPNSIKKGWTYTVTADGLFFTEQVRVGDVLIAEVDSPTALADWTTVQNNIDLASASQVGIGNVNAGTGISISYASGTATVTNTDTNSNNTDTGQITAGSTSGTVTHNFGTTNVIVQTYLDNATDNYPTVFCDITRSSNTVTATIAAVSADNIIILVQKIG
jgi:hypothetical protein